MIPIMILIFLKDLKNFKSDKNCVTFKVTLLKKTFAKVFKVMGLVPNANNDFLEDLKNLQSHTLKVTQFVSLQKFTTIVPNPTPQNRVLTLLNLIQKSADNSEHNL